MTLEKNCQRRYFNPLPPHGGRPAAASYLPPHEGISIHSLRMEGDRYAVCGNVAAANFNPLPPHGGRLSPEVLYPETLGFQSTPSAWRETCFLLDRSNLSLFQSTPSAWRETRPASLPFLHRQFQSTPSAWRETLQRQKPRESRKNFNPLPPHGGRRHMSRTSSFCRSISIHSLRMEGDPAGRSDVRIYRISIHSLRMEGDAPCR